MEPGAPLVAGPAGPAATVGGPGGRRRKGSPPRRTKVIATLGPASGSPEGVGSLLDAGADVVRLGLAHGTVEEHRAAMEIVRSAAAARGRQVGVLADLPGPKVRTGAFPEGGVFLAEGSDVVLTAGDGPSGAEAIAVDEPYLVDVVEPGATIVLGDGTVTLSAVAVEGRRVRCRVESGGRLQGRPGAHLPSDRWQPAVPTDGDVRLIEAVARDADWVAVSFVRTPEELLEVRRALGPDGPRLMAKIETRAAVDHLDDLLQVADGVMVARGDLGIDFPIEDVPHLQKRIIHAAGARGIPVVTATQMLESMVSAPTPTRAEATDVANAVGDGTDALMLSAETAIGHDPALTVATMGRIAARAEELDDLHPDLSERGLTRRRSPSTKAVTVAMAHAARRAADELGLAAIVCCTRMGPTARAMAALRPRCRLVGASPSPATARQLTLSWGVEPLVVAEYSTTDEMVWCVVEAAVDAGLVHHGDRIAVLAGAPDSTTRTTDVLRVVAVE
ncbi:MAG TPA: pyruvate kinase [Acidimicrobiales bacterium]|nr:pyruvate kinase [Acidimicrobiales bacterium]